MLLWPCFYFQPKLPIVVFQPFFLCIRSVAFLTQYFPSLPLCLGLFATGYNKPLYLLLPSFFWAKSITLTFCCFFFFSWLHHICGLQSFVMFSSSFISLYEPCFNTEMLVIGPWTLCAVYFHPSFVIAVLKVIQFLLYDILILWGIDTASRLCIVSISSIFQQFSSFCAKVINEHTKLDQMQDRPFRKPPSNWSKFLSYLILLCSTKGSLEASSHLSVNYTIVSYVSHL